MALILSLNYTRFAADESILAAIRSLVEVEEKYADGKYMYVVKEKQPELGFKIISDSSIVVQNTESENRMYKDIAAAKEKELGNYQKYYWDEQKKTKELEAKLKAFEALCPDSHKKEGE